MFSATVPGKSSATSWGGSRLTPQDRLIPVANLGAVEAHAPAWGDRARQ